SGRPCDGCRPPGTAPPPASSTACCTSSAAASPREPAPARSTRPCACRRDDSAAPDCEEDSVARIPTKPLQIQHGYPPAEHVAGPAALLGTPRRHCLGEPVPRRGGARPLALRPAPAQVRWHRAPAGSTPSGHGPPHLQAG